MSYIGSKSPEKLSIITAISLLDNRVSTARIQRKSPTTWKTSLLELTFSVL